MKPWPQEPLDRHKIWESSFSTTSNRHTSWSQYLRRTGIGAHRFEYPEHAKELHSFISFGYQIHVMALFAHQNRLSSIAESGSGVLLWLCQGAVPRRPARQFPVSARSTPSLQNKFNGKKKRCSMGGFVSQICRTWTRIACQKSFKIILSLYELDSLWGYICSGLEVAVSAPSLWL